MHTLKSRLQSAIAAVSAPPTEFDVQTLDPQSTPGLLP